ncbi:MAG: DUF1028 domain-containing protein [Litorilinea sp.]
MTFSIVAWDPATGAAGVAAATKFMAVGALCPFARAGVGALAAQAFVNPAFGPRALELLALDVPAEMVLQVLLENDPGQSHRQLHIVDRQGNSAAYTGTEAAGWAGHKTYPGFSVAGNMLVDHRTIHGMAQAYLAQAESADFPARLVAALAAGQAAGGDKRGRQSAALYIVPAQGLPIDLRIDDHPDPVDELHRIYTKATTEYLPLLQYMSVYSQTADSTLNQPAGDPASPATSLPPDADAPNPTQEG